jgi:hypothetical protein
VAKIVRPALDPEHKLGPLNKPRIYFLCGPDLNRIGVEQMSSHAWPSTSHRVRFVSPRDLLLDHRSDATSNKIAWSQHVSIPIVHVPLLPPAPRLDMALPAFTRATNATWMENHSLIYDWNPTASLQTWRSATRLLRGGRQLQFGRLVYLCSLKRAARFCTVYGTSVSWYARHSVCAILPVAEPFVIARNEEDGGAETSSAIHSFK